MLYLLSCPTNLLSGYKHWPVFNKPSNPTQSILDFLKYYQSQENSIAILNVLHGYWALYTHLYTTVEVGVIVILEWFSSYLPLHYSGGRRQCRFEIFHPTLLPHQKGWIRIKSYPPLDYSRGGSGVQIQLSSTLYNGRGDECRFKCSHQTLLSDWES